MVRQLTNPPQRHDVVIAAARKITLTEVSSTVSGDIDLNGVLGLNPDVRNGYQQIKVRFTVRATRRHRSYAIWSSSHARVPPCTT